jgi:hypothetical protein
MMRDREMYELIQHTTVVSTLQTVATLALNIPEKEGEIISLGVEVLRQSSQSSPLPKREVAVQTANALALAADFVPAAIMAKIKGAMN